MNLHPRRLLLPLLLAAVLPLGAHAADASESGKESLPNPKR